MTIEIADNIKYIIGSDEVGTGAYAGIFCVCAVRAPIEWSLEGLNDSKKLSEKKRLELEKNILLEYKNKNIQYSLLEISPSKIDDQGLGVALKFAHQCVINNLSVPQTIAIVDGKLNIQANVETKSLIRADAQIPTVMAASILAKCHRDRVMKKLHEKYPMYGWKDNVGYLVEAHKKAIKEHGLSPLHRKSFKVKNID